MGLITRWHLINLPVRFRDRQNIRLRVENLLISWPEPVVAGFAVRRHGRAVFLPWSPGVVVSPYGVIADSIHLLCRRQGGVLRSGEEPVLRWRGTPVDDGGGQSVGFVRDLVLDEMRRRVAALMVSRGLLHDVWSGALLVSWEEVQFLADGRIKWVRGGQTS